MSQPLCVKVVLLDGATQLTGNKSHSKMNKNSCLNVIQSTAIVSWYFGRIIELGRLTGDFFFLFLCPQYYMCNFI